MKKLKLNVPVLDYWKGKTSKSIDLPATIKTFENLYDYLVNNHIDLGSYIDTDSLHDDISDQNLWSKNIEDLTQEELNEFNEVAFCYFGEHDYSNVDNEDLKLGLYYECE